MNNTNERHGVQEDLLGNTGRSDLRELVIRQLIKDGLRLTISLPEAAKLLGISKNLIYQIANRGDFPTLTLGGRKVVSLIGLVEWTESQTDLNRRGAG